MAEEQATAPVEANEAPKSETASTNQEPAQAPAEAPKQEAPANTVTLTDEQKKFFESNGGLDKVFEKYKSAVANPEPKKEDADKPAEEPKKEEPKQEDKTQQPQPSKDDGYWSNDDIAAHNYKEILQKEYPELKEYIEKGDVIKEMSDLGMVFSDAPGRFNNRGIRKFLDIKKKTLPPKAPAGDTASTTPTVDYVNVGENIASREEAMKVIDQAGHPRRADALKFLANEINGNKGKK